MHYLLTYLLAYIYIYDLVSLYVPSYRYAFLRKALRSYVSLFSLLFIAFVSLYVPDEGNLLTKYTDCTTSNGFELYLICCGVMLLLLSMYIVGAKLAFAPSN